VVENQQQRILNLKEIMKENEKNKSNEKKAKYNPEVTTKNIDALGERIVEQKKDLEGDDAQLLNRQKKVDFTGNDLDVPGRDAPRTKQGKLKDEENELYSQGSGHNDHLEDAGNHQ
tara:strand:- start:2162 stop:2509 length:348 start_codon:yes stop_codon:yes gene_type:complete